MRYYPLFLDTKDQKIVFSGAGDHAAAKIRLLLKTSGNICVFGENPCAQVLDWRAEGKLQLFERKLNWQDVADARLVYGANDDEQLDREAAELGRWAGALTNIVDNLADSEFLTPAIVDRDPVTVAIGTEGTAPVLARRIKADVEEILPAATGVLAVIANGFRKKASRLATAAKRREFWQRFFFSEGPKALASGDTDQVRASLHALFDAVSSETDKPGAISFVGAGPGDPELLTLKARRKIHEAEIILHDQLVAPEILELARREATLINVGKKGFGKSWKQEDINALMIDHASKGGQIVRLKSGDPAVFGRLDEEIEALEIANVQWEVIPGITSASAAASDAGISLTRRGRNASLKLMTGHDVEGFAEHDWNNLAKPGATASIYMGLKASSFIRSRLLMHGASPKTPITVVSNASRANRKIITTTLGDLPEAIQAADLSAPAILLLGLAARHQSIEARALEGFIEQQQKGVA